MDFMFRRLKVYQHAIRLAEKLEADCRLIRAKGNYPMSDQIRRAAMSVPINIAEGNGRSTSADKRRFFIIARGSCFESASLLELSEMLGYVTS
ncbi:MAG: four helix bundle protein, partial [bacterium]